MSSPETPDVDRIVVPEEVAQTLSQTDAATVEFRAEVSFVEREQALKLRELKQNIDARRDYAFRLFCLICIWLGAVLAILVATGIDAVPFKLSDAVLLGLIGGTTATVLGLFLVVVKYLFPSSP